MALIVIAIAAGVLVGYARGGRLRQLLAQRPRRGRLVLTALGIYLVGVLGSWLWQPLLSGSMALCLLTIAYFAWVNRALHGAVLIGVGFAANAMVLLVNGAVPVSEAATTRAGAEFGVDDQHLAAADALLPWLGKIVPVAFPPFPEVVSVGDIAIAAGVGLFVASAMTPPRAVASATAAPPVLTESEPSQPVESGAAGTMSDELMVTDHESAADIERSAAHG